MKSHIKNWIGVRKDENTPMWWEKIQEAVSEVIDFSWFILDEVDENIFEKKERLRLEEEEKNNKKLELFLNHFKYLKVRYEKLITEYWNNTEIIKSIFLNIWMIKTSNLYSKENIEKQIFSYIDTKNSIWFDRYVSSLLVDWEWKKWFPKDIVKALLNINYSFKKIFPIVTDNYEVKNTDPWDRSRTL